LVVRKVKFSGRLIHEFQIGKQLATRLAIDPGAAETVVVRRKIKAIPLMAVAATVVIGLAR
jgi:hypothetical protein